MSDEEQDFNHHSLPVPEEIKTENAISALRRQEEEDSGSAFKKNRRRTLFLSCVALIALVALVGFMVGHFTSGERQEKSRVYKLDEGRQEDVTSKSAWDQVVSLLQTYTSLSKLQTTGTPQNEAANWMALQVMNNTLSVPVTREYNDAFEFVQRYALATFYFALDGPGWKYDLGFLGNQSVCQWNQEHSVMPTTFVMVNANNGETKTSGYGGDFTTEIPTSIGVNCNEAGEVNNIFIPDNNLKGQLPPELGLLEAMQHFSVYLNSISGYLPSSLEEWTDLEVIILEQNEIGGSLPLYVSQNWTKLLTLSLANNRFSGTLPSFAALTTLRSLALNGNQFTGPINVFDKNSQLDILFIQDNEFTGEITPTLLSDVDLRVFDCSNNSITGQLTSDWYSVRILDVHSNLLSGNLPEVVDDDDILYFSAYDNNFAGSIPESLGTLQDLYHLDLSDNGLTGSIPESLDDLESLEYLYLGNNQFDEQDFPYLGDCVDLKELSLRSSNINDNLPHFVGHWLRDLVLVDLSNNKLQGTIPANLAQAESIRFLLLGSNNFTGELPESFGELEDLNVLTLDHNPYLTGSMGYVCGVDGPEDLRHVLTDCTVECSCCKTCCSSDNSTCGNETLTPNLGGDGTYDRVSYIFNEELVFVDDADGVV